MSFTKRTIKDRVAVGDNKFTNSGTSSNLVLTPNPDSVTEAGTSVNADLLQRYEDALYATGNNIDGGTPSSPDGNNNIANGIMGSKITVRRGTASAWSNANPVLSAGEIGYDTTNKKFKIGDGSTAWNDLIFVGVAYNHFVFFSGIINTVTSGGRSVFLVFADKSNQPLSTVQNIITWLYSKGYTSANNAFGCIIVNQSGASSGEKIYTDGDKIYISSGAYYFTSFEDNKTFDCVTSNA